MNRDLTKPKRKENRKLLDEMKNRSCMVCKRWGCDPFHIKTAGSGGPDEPWNVIPVCRKCHTLWGVLGWKTFTERFPHFMVYLRALGWEVVGDDLWNPKIRLTED